MDHTIEAIQALSITNQVAFAVKDACIQAMTPQAAALGIEENTPVSSLLQNPEDYTGCNGGQLYLQLNIAGRTADAVVSSVGGLDIFVIDSNYTSTQALTMASVHMRLPLSSLMALTDRLLPEMVSQDSSKREEAAKISRELNRLHRIACNLSDASRYVSSCQKEVRNICSILEEALEHGQKAAQTKNITLTVSLPREDIFTQVDEELLKRAVYNLLSNSLKYTPSGGHIEVTLQRTGNRLLLSVTDSGPGFSFDGKTDLFSHYRRSSYPDSAENGIGLGLSLVKAAAAAHGGTVLIDHPQGKGARVTMTLSVTRAEQFLRSPIKRPDYAGGRDHYLLEFSDILPISAYYDL